MKQSSSQGVSGGVNDEQNNKSVIVNLITSRKVEQRGPNLANQPVRPHPRHVLQSGQSLGTYKLDSEKIAAANSAVMAAIEREKKTRIISQQQQQQQHIEQTDKSINSFYNLSISQIDILPVVDLFLVFFCFLHFIG